MVHNLRQINKATTTLRLPVPDPYVALRALDPKQQYFSVIDLANAFFCLPLAERCQECFAFTYRGEKYTYTRLNQALHQILTKISQPEGVKLMQYVDDLLIAAPTMDGCVDASHHVLQALAAAGFKVKKEKCQIARERVTFLGRQVGQQGNTLTNEQRQSIQDYRLPLSVQDMLAFLGLCGYSHS